MVPTAWAASSRIAARYSAHENIVAVLSKFQCYISIWIWYTTACVICNIRVNQWYETVHAMFSSPAHSIQIIIGLVAATRDKTICKRHFQCRAGAISHTTSPLSLRNPSGIYSVIHKMCWMGNESLICKRYVAPSPTCFHVLMTKLGWGRRGKGQTPERPLSTSAFVRANDEYNLACEGVYSKC